MFRSTDNGTTWSLAGTGISYPHIIALAARSTDEVFAGTNGAGLIRGTGN